MFNFRLKRNKFFIALALVFCFAFFNFNVGVTDAYFSSSANSSDNIFTAGTLSLSLDNSATYASGILYPGNSTSTIVAISNTGSLNSQYTVGATLLGSDTSACNYVTMNATTPANSYSGLIKDFISATTTTINTTWNLNFTVATNTPSNVWGKTCFFKLTYTAWQTNLPDSSSGFSSVMEKLGSVRIGKPVVLNEILAYPDATATAPANKEFIELYNNGDLSINLAGWQVSEMSGPTEHKYTITTATSGAYRAVPYGGLMTISPKGWIVLQLSSGTALNNDGDTVRLYDNGGNKLDEFTYYPPGKPKGYSYARIPDGVGAWVDPLPTPGGQNEIQENALMDVLSESDVELSDAVIDVATTTESADDDSATTTTPEIAPDTSDTTSDMASTTTPAVENEPVSDTVVSVEPESTETAPNQEQPTASEQDSTAEISEEPAPTTELVSDSAPEADASISDSSTN